MKRPSRRPSASSPPRTRRDLDGWPGPKAFEEQLIDPLPFLIGENEVTDVITGIAIAALDDPLLDERLDHSGTTIFMVFTAIPPHPLSPSDASILKNRNPLKAGRPTEDTCIVSGQTHRFVPRKFRRDTH